MLNIYIGDIVRIKSCGMCDLVIMTEFDSKLNEYRYYLYNHAGTFFEKDIVSETDIQRKLNEKNNNMAEFIVRKLPLNLSEKLKSFVGLQIFSINCGNGVIKSVRVDHDIRDTTESIIIDYKGNEVGYRADGRVFPSGEILLYPSEKLYHKYPLNPEEAWWEWLQNQPWRAGQYEEYYYIATDYTVRCVKDILCEDDDKRYLAGNYFKTKDEAKQYAEKFKNILLNR